MDDLETAADDVEIKTEEGKLIDRGSNSNHDDSTDECASLFSEKEKFELAESEVNSRTQSPPLLSAICNCIKYGRHREQTTSSSRATERRDSFSSEYNEKPTTRVYARRWVLLVLFSLYSMTSAYQWIHLNIIYDVVETYYNHSLPQTPMLKSLAIDSLSMVYMMAYVPLVLPASWLLDKKGLRLVAILATLLNSTGAWLKCAAVDPGRFPLLMLAQCLCAIAQVFILGVPTRLAAVWFGPEEVSTATSIGVFGNQFGVALGFVIPPYLVKLHRDDLGVTAKSLSLMFFSGAGYMTVLFILVVLVFRDSPSQPPSIAQHKALISSLQKERNYSSNLKKLLCNCPFILLLISYGMNVGVYYGIGTLLNPVILGYFKQEDFPQIAQHTGWIGLSLVVAGLVGAIIAGVWLDKTKLFKVTTLAIYLLSLAGMLAFTFTLSVQQIWVVYVTASSLGFFMTGYLPVGFEFAAELTYPQPEGTSTGLLNGSAQAFGVALTLLMGQILRLPGDEMINIRNSLIMACCVLFIGVCLTAAIRNNLYRQAAEHKDAETDEGEEVKTATGRMSEYSTSPPDSASV